MRRPGGDPKAEGKAVLAKLFWPRSTVECPLSICIEGPLRVMPSDEARSLAEEAISATRSVRKRVRGVRTRQRRPEMSGIS